NDGIYLPPNEEVFGRYRAGIRRLIARVRSETNGRLVLLTPPPFDAAPFLNKPPTNPPDWRRPADNYDRTLAQFSAWLMSLRNEGVPVIDLHTPINEHLQARRNTNPRFILARDGVHLDATGHWLIAQIILEAWNAPGKVTDPKIDARGSTTKSEHIKNLQVHEGSVSFLWTTPLPMPLDPQCNSESLKLLKTTQRFNKYDLTITGLGQAQYWLEANGERLTRVSR